MPELNETFDPNTVPEDDRNFEPLPAGDYTMQVIDSQVVDTKTGSGQHLVLTLEVIDGPHSNRRVWDRLNIVNQNADAQRIALRALADLCLATGIPSLRETEALHFKPFTAMVTIKTDKTGQYGPQNRVRYKPRVTTAPARPAPAQKAAGSAVGSAAKPAATGVRPWAKAV